MLADLGWVVCFREFVVVGFDVPFEVGKLFLVLVVLVFVLVGRSFVASAV